MTERLRTGHLSVITRLDSGWSPRLRRQFSGSVMPWLFVVGEPSLLCSRSIGIGGSRDATARSLELTRELSLRLAERGVVIVSGGARGVDGAAHRAALSVGGKTIVVLAQGIGTFQISDHWHGWIERGSLTIVSKFAPMDEWESFRALQRNATVGRLGEAFLVVQAGLKSGTLSAGQSALRSKVPLYVIAQTGANAESFHGNEQLVREGGVALRIAPEPSSLDQAV